MKKRIEPLRFYIFVELGAYTWAVFKWRSYSDTSTCICTCL